jgi:hypothetical protein
LVLEIADSMWQVPHKHFPIVWQVLLILEIVPMTEL